MFLCQILQEMTSCWTCTLTELPYQNGNCENVKEITLLDKCVLKNNGTFYKKTNLFPSKIPNNFQKCVINVASIGKAPSVILNRKEEEYGKTVYDIRGLLVEIFRLSMKKMKTTVFFISNLH